MVSRRAQLLATLVAVVALLTIAAYEWRHRAIWTFVGVASDGDTVWVDLHDHLSYIWSGHVKGPASGERWPGLEVDCGAHTVRKTQRASVVELRTVIADTVCAHAPASYTNP